MYWASLIPPPVASKRVSGSIRRKVDRHLLGVVTQFSNGQPDALLDRHHGGGVRLSSLSIAQKAYRGTDVEDGSVGGRYRRE